jgi:hypothetical protein
VGGRLVYSTCTFNPIEDEAVVAELLVRCKGSLELVDVADQLPALKRLPGMRTWRVRDKGAWWAAAGGAGPGLRGACAGVACSALLQHLPPTTITTTTSPTTTTTTTTPGLQQHQPLQRHLQQHQPAVLGVRAAGLRRLGLHRLHRCAAPAVAASSTMLLRLRCI